jgi:hypothetical protein
MGFGRPLGPIFRIPNFFLKNTEKTLLLTYSFWDNLKLKGRPDALGIFPLPSKRDG